MLKKTSRGRPVKNQTSSEEETPEKNNQLKELEQENQKLTNQLETQSYLISLRDEPYRWMMLLSQMEQINANLQDLKEKLEGLSLEEETEEDEENSED